MHKNCFGPVIYLRAVGYIAALINRPCRSGTAEQMAGLDRGSHGKSAFSLYFESRFDFMKSIFIYIIASFFALVISKPVYSSEWYKGGTLHQATVATWRQSSYSNRLATAGDWFVSITKSHNPSLRTKLDTLSATQYLSALKQFAVQLEKCVSDTASLNSQGRVFSKPNDRIAEIASICYVSMYGVK